MNLKALEKEKVIVEETVTLEETKEETNLIDKSNTNKTGDATNSESEKEKETQSTNET